MGTHVRQGQEGLPWSHVPDIAIAVVVILDLRARPLEGILWPGVARVTSGIPSPLGNR